jgi:hypothetical protein
MMIIDPKNVKLLMQIQPLLNFTDGVKKSYCKRKFLRFNILGEKEIQNGMSLAQQEKRNCFIFKHLIADGSLRDVEVI